MKKTAKSLALGLLGILAVFFFALPVQAQSGHFVLVQQGKLPDQTPYTTGILQFEVRIGTGYVGTTTGAFMAVSGVSNTTASAPASLVIVGYPLSSYTGTSLTCRYDMRNQPAGSYSATSTNPFMQLDFQQEVDPGACTFRSSYYYKVQMTSDFSNAGIFNPGSVGGLYGWVPPTGWATTTATISNFFPYFTIVADGFQITPTASSSGLFLSGAQEFCHSQFGSSTSFGSDIGNGICIAVGYLFVPTPESVQAIPNLQTSLALHAPFSWVYGTISTWNTLSASSSVNLPIYTVDSSKFDFSSSTALGSILPSSITLLSTSTINTYLPAGIHDTLYTLASFAIALSAVGYMFSRTRKIFVLES